MKVQRKYMERCLELACLGAGRVAPNPMVGCVIVKEDVILGEGYHREYGKEHAEVNAIRSSGLKTFPAEAVMYVSLEPCNHYGKTPPCTRLIVDSGIRNVVIACRDTKQSFEGGGLEFLQREGVNVHYGLLEKEALDLNRRFFVFHQQKRPYIILKWAQTADGYIGYENKSAGQLVISNTLSHQLVHRWRSEESAIMAGAQTLIQDNPRLNVRLWSGPNPVRIVIDQNLMLDKKLNVFNNDSKVIVYNQIVTKTENHLEYRKTDTTQLGGMLTDLYELKIQSLLVEGGTKTLNRFLQSGLWDEMRVLVSDHRTGSGVKAPVFDFSGGELFNLAGNRLFILKK